MRIALAAALLVMIQAPAWAGASFDCNKASTPVETTICAEMNWDLGLRDIALDSLYRSVKDSGEHDGLIARQPAWLRERDACGSDAACLKTRYDERLAELAAAAGDTAGVTGHYAYHEPEGPSGGDALVIRMADGTLMGMVETVSGPTSHICSFEFDEAEDFGRNAWLWTGPAEDVDFDGKVCRVVFHGDGRTLGVGSRNCSAYCGARGYFDNAYERVK